MKKRLMAVTLLLTTLFWKGAPVLGEPLSFAQQDQAPGPGYSPEQVDQDRKSDRQQLDSQRALLAHLDSPVPSQDVEGALAPLARSLGSDGELAFISWKPVDFEKAARAGFTTVWLGAGGFLKLSSAEQQSVLAGAERAKLRTLGFIGGDPDWVNPGLPDQPARAVEEYRRLTQALGLFSARNSGPLKFAFGVDVEPYVREWWDGDLSRYSVLIQKISVPVQEFRRKHRNRMEAKETYLIRFEPFWWKNGHVTESGKVIRGLQDTGWSHVASMTYRDRAESLLEVSASIRARAQEMGKHGMRFFLGAETKPAGPGIPDYITFDGQLAEMAGELVKTIRGMPAEDRKWMQGVFIHSGKAQADQALDTLLATVPVAPLLAAVSPLRNAFAVGLGGERLAILSLNGKKLRARDLHLRGFDPSAEVVFISRSLVKVTTSSGRVYYVKV